MAAAFAAGAAAIEVFSDIDALLTASDKYPAEQRLRAGERGGQQLEGFDLGNSPLDHSPNRTQGRRLFMSTTNGTRCLQRIQQVPTVMTAALTTRQATVNVLLDKQPETVWLVGSGWEGTYSLEDTVCAGAIADQLFTKLGCSLTDLAGNDSLVAAISLYRQWQNDLLGLMHTASHGQRLLRLKNTEDLDYCAQLDVLDIVPIQASPGVLVQGD